MRVRLLGAVAALLGCAAVASADTPPVPSVPPAPTSPPAGLTPIPTPPPAALPPAALPATPAAPPILVVNPDCGTPAPAYAAPAPCAECKAAAVKAKKRTGLLSRCFIGAGTANPVGCGCLAAEKTLMFGGCRQFFTPGQSCCGDTIEYGPGGMYNKDNCKHVTSFLNR